MKMRSKGLLAYALTFCMIFSGTVPVGAASDETGTEGRQMEQVVEDLDEGEGSSQEQQDGQIEGDDDTGDGIHEDGIHEDDIHEDGIHEDGIHEDDTQTGDSSAVSADGESIIVPEETAVSADAVLVPEEEPAAGTAVSENRASEEAGVVESPQWVQDGSHYKLKKTEGDGYYSEDDGLVRVQEAYYAFDAQGYMRTGSNALSISVETEGVYYFLTAEDCQGVKDPTPENSKLGQLVTQSGWYYAAGEGKWLYLKEKGVWDNTKVGKQIVSDGKTYFLDKDGSVKKNAWEKINGSTYYFGTDGVMVAGRAEKIEGSTYYFGANGVMAVNCFVTVEKGKQYYFASDGKRFEKTGWQRLSNSFYYFDTDYSRRIKTGWQQIKVGSTDGWYYFSSQGVMYADKLFKNGGYQYYVNKTGKMVTGLRQVNGKRYFFRKKAEGKAPVGSAYKGWKKINTRWYYFRSNFQAETRGVVKIAKKYYSFDANGRMYKGGWKVVNGKTYYFQKQTSKARNGYAVVKKWLKKSGKWYYATAKGFMRTSAWMKYKGNLYYFNKNGVMVTNKWRQYNGKWGYLNGDGIFSQNWVKVNGKWKYAKDNGQFAKGWTYIVQNGTRYKYYFNNKGYLLQDVRGKVSGPYMLKVDRKRNQVTVYARDVDGQYNIPVVAMPCSVGLPATPTPTGRFTGTRAGRWQLLMGPSWGQYATLVDAANGIFFHSVSGPVANSYSLPANEWNKLGREAASHGCIRVAVIDAKWIYENCDGCIVEVQDYANAGPFDHKTYRQITAAYNWDPTDPAARGYI